MTAAPERIPATLLTGFLGSGKTTLLNHILTTRRGLRIAVIENEVGEVDVDSDLVLTSREEIFQVVNDCLCCVISVRDDLARILHTLLARRGDFDHILVEASGLSDPTPVAATFFKDPVLARELVLDGIVTLVDALHAERHLDDPALAGGDNLAYDQIAVADRILINKADLVDPADLDRLEARLLEINGGAEVLRCSHARVDLDRILGIQGFAPAPFVIPADLDLGEAQLAGDEHHDHDHDHGHAQRHGHDESLGSVALRFDRDFDREALSAWLEALVAERGDDLFRLKGILAVAGDPRRQVLQAVHRVLELRPAEPWGAEPRLSKLVFIGRHLERPVLQAGLARCLAAPESHRPDPDPRPRRTA